MSEFVLIAWVAVSFLIANNSQTKLFWYMYPIYPPLSIIIAKTLMDFVRCPNLLNQAAYYVGILPILGIVLIDMVKQEPLSKAIGITLGALCAMYITAVALKKYLSKFREHLRILLVCVLCVVPVLLAFKKND